MKTTILILLLIASIGVSAQNEITVDTSKYTLYAEMTISEYYGFNQLVSEASGYKLGDKTERLMPMGISNFSFTNGIIKVIVPIEPHNQKYYSKQLKDINKIARKDTTFENIEIEFINQKTYDWFAEHYEKNGDKTKKWIYVNSTIDKGKAPIDIKDKTRIK